MEGTENTQKPKLMQDLHNLMNILKPYQSENMEKTQEAQKPKTTMEDLEQMIGTYNTIEAKAAEKEMPEYLSMMLLCAATECVPEHLRQYGNQLLSVKLAQKAYAALQDGRIGDAAGYSMLAQHYAKKGGIDLPDQYQKQLKEMFNYKGESKEQAKKAEPLYNNSKPGYGKPESGLI